VPAADEGGRKQFFFKKKNQKTFATWLGAGGPSQGHPHLLLFVHKKKCCPFLMLDEDTSWQRLDKFLFYARFCKTRAVAASLIEQVSVRINGQPTEKPHARLRPGDILTLPLPRGVVVVQVTGFAKRRESAARALLLYKEIAAS
jgi:ribosome-associated heat shock protein Hsp15